MRSITHSNLRRGLVALVPALLALVACAPGQSTGGGTTGHVGRVTLCREG